MPRKAKKSAKAQGPEAVQPETAQNQAETETAAAAPKTGMQDPVGDTTDGEAHVYLGDAPADEKMPASGEADAAFEKEAVKAKPEELAPDEEPEGGIGAGADDEVEPREDADEEDDEEPEATEAAPAKLERLQKILSQAGISSRRRAEELITEGRVQVNGTVVTTLGTKADPERDHIRVDGKLLHGAERLRYFALNKPKGFVTTVSDPEGRPTVMQFFGKTRERLYPVGRLDYQSEGLLLVTNDGDLANRLTRAGSGVEKTYLVKVAGRPSEEELETLRGGVAIEQAGPGTKKVRTAPAQVRQVRGGDNPWFEVVLIEGRNRELRKMFSAIGHFVEKIRRVGYGPLVLDQEPGKMRELDPAEVDALRLAAEGKLPKNKGRGKRRDFAQDLDEVEMLVLPAKSGRPRTAKPAGAKRFEKKGFSPRAERGGFRSEPRGEFRGKPRGEFRSDTRSEARGEFRPKRSFGQDKPRFEGRSREDRPREGRTSDREFRPGARQSYGKPTGEQRGFGGDRRRPEGRDDRGFSRERRGPGEREEHGFSRARRGPEEREGRSFSRPRSEEREERGFGRGRRGPQEGGERGSERGFRGRAPQEGTGRDRMGESGRPAFKPRFERPRREEREGFEERSSRPRAAKPKFPGAKFQGAKTEGRGFGRDKKFGARSTGSGYGEKPRADRGSRSFSQDERPRTGRVRPSRTEGGFKSSGFKGKGSFKGGPAKGRGAKPGRPQRRPGGGFGKKRG